MPVPAGWDQAKAHERAVQLLEGAAPFEEQSGSIEFSHGTWRQRRAEPRAISSSLPAAAEVALKESRRAAVQALPESKEADHAAVLRRTWTDIDFDGGEDANQKLVQALEAEFAEQLASTMHGPAVPHAVDANDQMESSCEGSMREVLSDVLGAGDPEEPAAAPTNEEVVNVLGQSDNLGASLDMIGAYLKNYMTDKADMVLRRVMPLCRERGGFWLIKALNIAACVCSKQGRHEEALTALEELERLVGARLADLGGGEAAAWAFYDMVYKNFGWTLEALGRHAEAFGYFERAAELKRASGVAPTWFDQWDLGRTLAHMAYELGRGGELSRAGGLLRDALELQHRSEPGDAITRGKLLKSCGECEVARGELAGALQEQLEAWAAAERHLREARALFLGAAGPSSPLVGLASADLAAVLMRRRRWPEARAMLQQALRCECRSDVIELPRLWEAVECLLAVRRALGDEDGPDGERYETDVLLGLSNLRRRRIDASEPLCYAALMLQVSRLIGVRGALLQEAAACLQLAWEDGPDARPDPTLSLHVFQSSLGPQLLPPRARRQGFQVSLQSLLRQFQAAIAELPRTSGERIRSGAPARSEEKLGAADSPSGGYQAL
eukprot:CAMPEP_0175667518 /NCGR_PEP_ID=MMETSP0097-20121207/18145_1 /TAXON_ID=311494 /ORGANISM="Alexandrium monilatum, Strain CCMP3105" /LENGTH=612 /DNA_ID=CAMNT_0016973983 /DNA_START=35 /DNA_END=1870 /DNA_ORIENTATION=+